MSRLDHSQGYRYADELLSNANPVEVVVNALDDWRKITAHALIETAEKRIAACINIDYQKGVLERAREELE